MWNFSEQAIQLFLIWGGIITGVTFVGIWLLNRFLAEARKPKLPGIVYGVPVAVAAIVLLIVVANAGHRITPGVAPNEATPEEVEARPPEEVNKAAEERVREAAERKMEESRKKADELRRDSQKLMDELWKTEQEQRAKEKEAKNKQ